MSKTKKPRREPTSVTIANLERELHNATQRCADLMAARDNYQKLANQREIRIAELGDELAMEKRLRSVDFANYQDEKSIRERIEYEFQGYRRATRELMHE